MLKIIEERLEIKSLREDLRKIAVNFITTGTVGLFITHIVGLTFIIAASSVWVAIMGLILLFFGLFKRKSHG